MKFVFKTLLKHLGSIYLKYKKLIVSNGMMWDEMKRNPNSDDLNNKEHF